jgi:Super-infection exclusion protein B
LLSGLGSLISTIVAAGAAIYAAVFIAAGLLLFLPVRFLNRLGLDQLGQSYRMYVGLAFLIAASLLFVRLILFLWQLISIPYENWLFEQRGVKLMRELTEEEKAFLRPYIVNGQNSRVAPVGDGVAQGLAAGAVRNVVGIGATESPAT